MMLGKIAVAAAAVCTLLFGSMKMHALEKSQSVGLVLSGGGAKGIAHIGVIKALEENDIPIDYISGTSMGAIVGGLYAAGYTTDEMMELIKSREFTDAASGKIDERYTYYFLRDANEPNLFTLNIGDKSSATSILPTSVINPIPMNFEFMALFSPFTAQCGGDFNKLFVPFRAVASDVTHKHKVVWSHGSLGEAIRSSMSFPLVFSPVQKDGALLYDGGIYDNFPVQVMTTEFAPSIIIGVDVSTPDSVTANPDMITQLSEMITQPGRGKLTPEQGIYIHINLSQFGLLDFAKADKISAIGYARAMEAMDSIKGRITARIPAMARNLRRDMFKSQTPYLRFDSITVTGASKKQNNYIRSYFTHFHSDTFGVASAASSYYRLAAPGKFRALDPTAVYNDSTGLFGLNLKASVKSDFTVGFGGYVSTTTSSMLYFSGAYKTLSYNSLSMGLSVWAGQSYLAGMLHSKVNFATSMPSALTLEVIGSRHKFYDSEKLFFEENQPSYVTSSEAFARLIYGFAPNHAGSVNAGVGIGYVGDRYYQTIRELPYLSRDNVKQTLAQAVVSYKSSTLNNNAYPTRGAEYTAVLMGVTGHRSVTHYAEADASHRTWAQLEASTRNYFTLNRYLSLGTEIGALISTRKLLHDYDQAVVDAPAFVPTPTSYDIFDPSLRANSFVTAGLVPVWRVSSMIQLRAACHAFMPYRPIYCGEWNRAFYGNRFSKMEFFGELTGVLSLPFANVSAFGHYSTSSAGGWNFGVSLGVFMPAPRFLRYR